MYMIYGVSDCPWCLKAQAFCMENGLEYSWVMMDYAKEYREWIQDKWKWQTIPVILKVEYNIDGPDETLIGGYEELTREHS